MFGFICKIQTVNFIQYVQGLLLHPEEQMKHRYADSLILFRLALMQREHSVLFLHLK